MSRVPQKFFERSAAAVARGLIGMRLVRQTGGKTFRGIIIETEAYGEGGDRASHARFGKTARNWPLFETGGTVYVYLTYGMHWLLNISSGREGKPSAVLIRGVIMEGTETPIALNGPGKLTKFLHIDGSLSGKTLGGKAGLWVESVSEPIPARRIQKTPRIGIDYAGEWAGKLLRFVLIQEPNRLSKKSTKRVRQRIKMA